RRPGPVVSCLGSQHDGSTDGRDSFEFGDDVLKDEWSLGDDDDEEEEEDLKAMVETIRDRAELSAPSSAHRQLSMLDFLRSFLSQRNMTGTLECFETEWVELGQTGVVDPRWADPVPEVYTENQRLAGELKNTEREKEEYRHINVYISFN
uniref:Uncharacterized protein n=1 Tax=Fundulus heteroclitus TaxID=8078 RepID=A0A3Q2NVM4_FUNHE